MGAHGVQSGQTRMPDKDIPADRTLLKVAEPVATESIREHSLAFGEYFLAEYQVTLCQKSARAAAVAPGCSALGECPAPGTCTQRAPSLSAISACSVTGQA
jgi:hypothetical protein